MKQAIVFYFLIALSLTAASLPVEIEVPETVKGNRAYLDYSDNIDVGPQIFVMDWENQGSVSCRTRIRIDIYNETKRIQSAWSKEAALEPGNHSSFELYFYPGSPGTFTASISSYYCNTIEYAGNFSFTVSAHAQNVSTDTAATETRGDVEGIRNIPFEITVENTENLVEMGIKARENITGIVIVPRGYPAGWIFEGGRADHLTENEERIVPIGYVPSIWKPLEIEFDIATLDGKYHSIEKVQLEIKEADKGYAPEHVAILFLSVAVTILAILFIRERKKQGLT